jgi:hypothetical protein
MQSQHTDFDLDLDLQTKFANRVFQFVFDTRVGATLAVSSASNQPTFPRGNESSVYNVSFKAQKAVTIPVVRYYVALEWLV